MKLMKLMNNVAVVVVLVVFVTSLCINNTFAAGGGVTPAGSVDPGKHFHPKGKMPSKHTRKIFDEARANLPFSDKQDFEENKKGFIAAPTYKK